MSVITEILLSLVLLVFLSNMIMRCRRDDTDTAKERSGLLLYTDAKTGVQYVGTVFGGLTARIDAAGRPKLADKD